MTTYIAGANNQPIQSNGVIENTFSSNPHQTQTLELNPGFIPYHSKINVPQPLMSRFAYAMQRHSSEEIDNTNPANRRKARRPEIQQNNNIFIKNNSNIDNDKTALSNERFQQVWAAMSQEARQQMETLLSTTLTNRSQRIYNDGSVLHGLKGLPLSEAFDQVKEYLFDTLYFGKNSGYPALGSFNNEQIDILADQLTRAFPEFSINQQSSVNIKYGSQEWGKLRLGILSLQEQGRNPNQYSVDQLLQAGETALKTDQIKNKSRLLYLLAGASGHLDLEELSKKTPAQIQSALTQTANEVFARELKGMGLVSKLALMAKQGIPHRTDGGDYDAKFKQYRQAYGQTIKDLFTNQIETAPHWLRASIEKNGVAFVTPQVKAWYNTPYTHIDSSKNKEINIPTFVPLVIKVKQGNEDRFALFRPNRSDLEILPPGTHIDEWFKNNLTSFFPNEWQKAKREQILEENPLPQDAPLGITERPLGNHFVGFDFTKSQTSVNMPLSTLQNMIYTNVNNDFGKRYEDSTTTKVFKEIGGMLMTLLEMVPGVSEIEALARGDWGGFALSLGMDSIGIFGGEALKGLGGSFDTIENGFRDLKLGRSIDLSMMEGLADFKLDETALTQMTNQITDSHLFIPGQFSNIQIGETRPWTHPSTGQSLTVTRLVDSNQVVALQSQGGGSWREVDWNSGKIRYDRPLVYQINGQFGHGGLVGGAPATPPNVFLIDGQTDYSNINTINRNSTAVTQYPSFANYGPQVGQIGVRRDALRNMRDDFVQQKDNYLNGKNLASTFYSIQDGSNRQGHYWSVSGGYSDGTINSKYYQATRLNPSEQATIPQTNRLQATRTGSNPRTLDTEFKILSDLDQKLLSTGTNKNTPIHIILWTEKPPCVSCAHVFNQFKQNWPNAEILVIKGNGPGW